MNEFIIYLIVEGFSNLILFPILNNYYGAKRHDGEKIHPALKGIIERVCLISGLLLNLPHILVAFGALKIGTKLGGQPKTNEDKTDTEYYLVGNLCSILMVFLFIFLKDKLQITTFDFVQFFKI